VGRLFWKFFFFFMLAQVTTVVAVSSAIWLRNRSQAVHAELPRPHQEAKLPDAASAPRDREPGRRQDP